MYAFFYFPGRKVGKACVWRKRVQRWGQNTSGSEEDPMMEVLSMATKLPASWQQKNFLIIDFWLSVSYTLLGLVSCNQPRDNGMFSWRPVPGFGRGCEDEGAVVLELDRTEAGILWERDSKMAAIPQLQSSCGGSGVRLSTFVSVEVLKKGSGQTKTRRAKFYITYFWCISRPW